MLRPLRKLDLPTPQVQDFYPQQSQRGGNPGRGYAFAQALVQALNDWAKALIDIINTGNQVQTRVPTVASAASIAISAYITHVSGVAVISNITVEKDFGGAIVLIADGAWSLTTGGNIAYALVPGVNQAVFLAYDHNKGLWYPAGNGS